MKIAQTTIILLLLSVLLGCESYFTDYGPQPDFIEEPDVQNRLNLFGVLRPDSLEGMPASFVFVERAASFVDGYDSLRIADAAVCVSSPLDTLNFTYTDFDAVFSDSAYRHPVFVPAAGQTYRISCLKEGYPEVTAETTVPNVPEIIQESAGFRNNLFEFEIKRDALAVVYDIYFTVENTVAFERVRRPELGNTVVQLELKNPSHGQSGSLLIYAYDINLSEYISYNINIKFNTYRADYSTVQNGYGCFGSLNMLETEIGL